MVAEWKKVRDDMCLHVHCYVSGPSLLRDLAAEFRYHIFTKEMPLVSFSLPATATVPILYEKNSKIARTHL